MITFDCPRPWGQKFTLILRVPGSPPEILGYGVPLRGIKLPRDSLETLEESPIPDSCPPLHPSCENYQMDKILLLPETEDLGEWNVPVVRARLL